MPRRKGSVVLRRGGAIEARTKEVVEGERLTHEPSKRLRKGGNLCMDVNQKCIGGPSSLFPNCAVRDAMEVQGHGTASAQRVAADRGGVKASQFSLCC